METKIVDGLSGNCNIFYNIMSIHRFISLVLHENKWLLNEKEQVRIFLLYWSRVQLCDYIRFCTSCYIRLRRSEEEKDDGFYQSYAHWFDMNTLILHSYHHLIMIIFPNFALRLFSLSLFVSVVRSSSFQLLDTNVVKIWW